MNVYIYVIITAAGTSFATSLINNYVENKRYVSANKILKEKLENEGYDIVEKKYYEENDSLCDTIAKYLYDDDDDDDFCELEDSYQESSYLANIPLLDLLIAFKNICSLNGRKQISLDGRYDYILDNCLNKKIIKKLLKKDIIKENIEKIQKKEDYKLALAKLENSDEIMCDLMQKYDNNELSSTINNNSYEVKTLKKRRKK